MYRCDLLDVGRHRYDDAYNLCCQPVDEETTVRVTQQAMDAGHERIVEGAARLLRERGVRGTSVADAMKEADLTHGGFYRHFKSKDDLVIEALRRAFDDFTTPLELRSKLESPPDVAAEFKSLYLSDDHLQNPGLGCPMPTTGSELGRESLAVRTEFGAGLQRVVTALAKAKDGSDEERETRALKDICQMVGAVLLARASDPETAQRILLASRN
jgi:TetR/AcrR family transcriptional repressor of nem operon